MAVEADVECRETSILVYFMFEMYFKRIKVNGIYR